MSELILQYIDSAPTQGNDDKLTFELIRWLTTLADTLNTTIQEIQDELNIITGINVISADTQQAIINAKYVPTNDITRTAITLPSIAEVGSFVSIIGEGLSGWSLNTNVGQTIKFAASSASTSISSAERYDAILVTCVVSDTTWVVTSYVSTGLIIV